MDPTKEIPAYLELTDNELNALRALATRRGMSFNEVCQFLIAVAMGERAQAQDLRAEIDVWQRCLNRVDRRGVAGLTKGGEVEATR